MRTNSPVPEATQFDDAFVQALFDRMGTTYHVMNLVSSFGFSEFWRRRCVADARIPAQARVCDMMSGSGECWRYIRGRGAHVVSIDFSRVMVRAQTERNQKLKGAVDVRCENALNTSLADESIDCVVSAFGLKTLSRDAVRLFAQELHRIMKPGGTISLLEISTAEGWLLSPLYRGYISYFIPLIGKFCLADMECYRMLGRYTEAFGSCEHLVEVFSTAGFDVHVKRHFFGCATSLVGTKRR